MASPADPAGLAALEFGATPEGVRLRLRVKPGARRNALIGVHAGALKISGAGSQDKTVGIPLDPAELMRRLSR